MSWIMIRVEEHRDESGTVWRVTQVWENELTGEQRKVSLQGRDLKYVEKRSR